MNTVWNCHRQRFLKTNETWLKPKCNWQENGLIENICWPVNSSEKRLDRYEYNLSQCCILLNLCLLLTYHRQPLIVSISRLHNRGKQRKWISPLKLQPFVYLNWNRGWELMSRAASEIHPSFSNIGLYIVFWKQIQYKGKKLNRIALITNWNSFKLASHYLFTIPCFVKWILYFPLHFTIRT